jgi:hypothetical protein
VSTVSARNPSKSQPIASGSLSADGELEVLHARELLLDALALVEAGRHAPAVGEAHVDVSPAEKPLLEQHGAPLGLLDLDQQGATQLARPPSSSL